MSNKYQDKLEQINRKLRRLSWHKHIDSYEGGFGYPVHPIAIQNEYDEEYADVWLEGSKVLKFNILTGLISYNEWWVDGEVFRAVQRVLNEFYQEKLPNITDGEKLLRNLVKDVAHEVHSTIYWTYFFNYDSDQQAFSLRLCYMSGNVLKLILDRTDEVRIITYPPAMKEAENSEQETFSKVHNLMSKFVSNWTKHSYDLLEEIPL